MRKRTNIPRLASTRPDLLARSRTDEEALRALIQGVAMPTTSGRTRKTTRTVRWSTVSAKAERAGLQKFGRSSNSEAPKPNPNKSSARQMPQAPGESCRAPSSAQSFTFARHVLQAQVGPARRRRGSCKSHQDRGGQDCLRSCCCRCRHRCKNRRPVCQCTKFRKLAGAARPSRW